MGSMISSAPKKDLKYIQLEQLAEEIKKHSYVIALTGAGISRDSGLPSFRDPSDGIWLQYDPITCATIWGFWKSPEKLWQLLCSILKEVDPKPNSGHDALAILEERGHLKAIITQNIDNLHQDAGSKNVIEYHGNIMKAICCSCYRSSNLNKQLLRDMNFVKNLPPKCTSCGKILKPDVVLFGEAIPQNTSKLASKEAKHCDMLLIIGTSASVYPAAGLAFSASKNGATIVEINLEETDITSKITDYFVKSSSSDLIMLARTLSYKSHNIDAPKITFQPVFND